MRSERDGASSGNNLHLGNLDSSSSLSASRSEREQETKRGERLVLSRGVGEGPSLARWVVNS